MLPYESQRAPGEQSITIMELDMNVKRVIYDGMEVNLFSSKRMRMFKQKGTTCVTCGITGDHLHIEKCHKEDKTWHFNLYATDEYGEEMLMTMDHILPVSKGGKDGLYNLQPMCSKCNAKKGNGEGRKYRP